jgi:hypothetical protein
VFARAREFSRSYERPRGARTTHNAGKARAVPDSACTRGAHSQVGDLLDSGLAGDHRPSSRVVAPVSTYPRRRRARWAQCRRFMRWLQSSNTDRLFHDAVTRLEGAAHCANRKRAHAVATENITRRARSPSAALAVRALRGVRFRARCLLSHPRLDGVISTNGKSATASLPRTAHDEL